MDMSRSVLIFKVIGQRSRSNLDFEYFYIEQQLTDLNKTWYTVSSSFKGRQTEGMCICSEVLLFSIMLPAKQVFDQLLVLLYNQ